jgi:hypothetical protein
MKETIFLLEVYDYLLEIEAFDDLIRMATN